MGTNYYAYILPSEERKSEIKKAIDNNSFNEIRHLVEDTYDTPHYGEDTYAGGKVHLGKRSSGWKFLWNPNWYKISKGHCDWIENEDGSKTGRWHDDGFDVFKYYDLTKEAIKDFVMRDDVVIYNEYDEKQDKGEFLSMAFSWGYAKERPGLDSETYYKEEKEKGHYVSPTTSNSQTQFLKDCGFTLSFTGNDFYSDGLRFSTCNEFS